MKIAGQIQHLPAVEVYAALASHPGGLDSAEAAERLREVGRNSVEMHDRWRHLRSLLHQFANFFALLLIVSAILCFVAEYLQPGENMLVLGWALMADDPLYRAATGVALASVLLMQAGNVLGRRHLRRSGLDRGLLANRLLLAGIAMEVVFAGALLYWPPLQQILGTGPVAPEILLLAALGMPLVFGLDLLRKKLLDIIDHRQGFRGQQPAK